MTVSEACKYHETTEHHYQAPSIKTLQALHWLDDTQRQALRDAIKRPLESPNSWHLSHAIDARMTELDAIADTYGVEWFKTHKGRNYAYLSTGETYEATLMLEQSSSRFFVQSWGAIAEAEGVD